MAISVNNNMIHFNNKHYIYNYTVYIYMLDVCRSNKYKYGKHLKCTAGKKIYGRQTWGHSWNLPYVDKLHVSNFLL